MLFCVQVNKKREAIISQIERVAKGFVESGETERWFGAADNGIRRVVGQCICAS